MFAAPRPEELLGITVDTTLSSSLPRSLTQSAPILDYAWYPCASARDRASFCFVASVRECPVKLLDASDGRVRTPFSSFLSGLGSIMVRLIYFCSAQLRASYRIVDHRERQVAPHSLAFNPGANRCVDPFRTSHRYVSSPSVTLGYTAGSRMQLRSSTFIVQGKGPACTPRLRRRAGTV